MNAFNLLGSLYLPLPAAGTYSMVVRRCLPVLARYFIDVPWIVFVTYWLLASLKTNKTAAHESFTSRYLIMLVEALGFGLLFSKAAGVGILGRHILPSTLALEIPGVVLTWLGIALALWARHHLGQYWSGRVTLKVDHQLIRTGPYAFFRHPIYSGLDLAAIGTALAVDRWRALAGVCIVVAGFWIKARREEAVVVCPLRRCVRRSPA